MGPISRRGSPPPSIFSEFSQRQDNFVGSIISKDFNPTRVRKGEVFINLAYIMPTQRKRAYRINL